MALADDWPRPIRYAVASFLNDWPQCRYCGGPAEGHYYVSMTFFTCRPCYGTGGALMPLETAKRQEVLDLALKAGIQVRRAAPSLTGVVDPHSRNRFIYFWPQDEVRDELR